MATQEYNAAPAVDPTQPLPHIIRQLRVQGRTLQQATEEAWALKRNAPRQERRHRLTLPRLAVQFRRKFDLSNDEAIAVAWELWRKTVLR